MEVSGRKEWADHPSANNQRQKQKTICQPCQSEGDRKDAEAFCETCNEFICTPCLKVHRKLTATKSHVIKSKDEMPKVNIKRTHPCSEFCADHKAEIIKFFCKDHDSVGCGDCMVLIHKTCSVKLVSDVSDNYDTSQELEQIRKQLCTLQRELSSRQNDIVNDLKATDEMREKVKMEIKLFRKEINEYLDNSEAGLLKKIDEMKTKQTSQLKHVQREFEKMETEMKECEKKIHQTSDKINDLFVAAKISHEHIKACQMSTEKLASRYDLEVLKFVKSKEFVTLLSNKCPIGEINVQKERRIMRGHNKKSLINAETRLLKSLTIKDNNDKADCLISGMSVLSRDAFLLVDFDNLSVKIFNVKENKITSRYTTADYPWDITSIDSKTYAVTTVLTGEILFINTTNGISKSHSIKVRVGCRGIDYHNGVLAVSFENPASVQLLDMKGSILQEFDISTHCSCPWYIALSHDNKSFIVSDYEKKALFEFSDDGNLKAKISGDDMRRPEGLVICNDGTVIVCCANISDRVSIVKPKTREVSNLAAEGVQRPLSVCLSDDQSRMYIFDGSDRQIKVFDIV